MNWSYVETIGDFTTYNGGPNGDSPVVTEVYLLRAEDGGRTWWRWRSEDGVFEGEPTPSREQAVEEGEEFAEDAHEEADLESVLDEIMDVGFFSRRVNRDDVRGLIDAIVAANDRLYISKNGRAWAWSGGAAPLVDAEVCVHTAGDELAAAYALRDAIS